jgi:hypothetical protein
VAFSVREAHAQEEDDVPLYQLLWQDAKRFSFAALVLNAEQLWVEVVLVEPHPDGMMWSCARAQYSGAASRRVCSSGRWTSGCHCAT